jgi:hypothetical protein
MAIEITSLFRDILESPEQKQQRQMAEGFARSQNAVSQLTGLATAAAPLVGTMAELQGRRTEALQRGTGRLLGRDVRSTSEKLQSALSQFNPQDPASVSQTTQMLQQMGLGAQGAQLASMALEEQQKAATLDQETKLRGLQQQQITAEMETLQAQANQSAIYRNSVAGLVAGTEYANRAESIRNGSMPAAEVQKISEKLTEKPNMDIVQGIVGGQYKTLQTDGLGNFTDLTGAKVSLAADDTIIKGSLQGGLGDMSQLSSNVQGELLEDKANSSSFISDAKNAIKFFEENPSSTTTVAGFAGIANSIVANARALADTLTITGSDSSAISLLDTSSYSDTWEELGITNAENKSMLLGLALSYAASSGQGTARSLSNQDVTRALQRVGAGQDDSRTVIRLLDLAMQDVDRSYRVRTEAKTNRTVDSLIPTTDISDLLNQ